MEQVTEKKERVYMRHLITPDPLPVRFTGSLCGFGSHWERPESESLSVMPDSWRPRGLHSPWNSPGQNTGVGGLSLLQGIFPTQESNPGLPHCTQFLYQLSHKGSPRILVWLAYPFSRGSLVISTLPFSFVPTTMSPLFY